MAIVSYRVYCDDCTKETVIRDDRMEDSPWAVNDKYGHSGVCPACNPAVSDDSATGREHEEVVFEDLDNIGDAGAENLRDEGFVTRQDVKDATDDEILEVSWVGEGGLESIRQEVQ